MGWPKASPRGTPIDLANTSVEPPAGNGRMAMMGFLGQSASGAANAGVPRPIENSRAVRRWP